MHGEYVKEWMTTNPLTISPDATLPDAHELMKEYNIRRLPVVDSKGRLVGIISQTDVREAEPSDATTLSIYELNYLLAKLKIKDIMTRAVLTVAPQTTIAEAAQIMLDKKIGGLPVMEGDKIVGIITESDIFRMVVRVFMVEAE